MDKHKGKPKYNFPSVYNKLKNIYRSLKSIIRNPHTQLQRQIESCLNKKDDVFFIQVGANDGLHGDPIRDLIMKNKHWKGMFIEPVLFLFNRLKINYREDKRFIFENVAIGTENELKKFYYLAENKELQRNIGIWYDQLGSFDKQHILKHVTSIDIEPFIFEEEVKCLTFKEILAKHKVNKIDLLHIDTEGFDYKVLAQVDFKSYKPFVILYEHKHLSTIEIEKAEFLLKNNGYHLTRTRKDIIAVLN